MPDRTVTTLGDHTLALTHLSKVLFEDGWTKGEMIAYAVEVAPFMVPHLQRRPASFLRAPGGPAGGLFWAKSPPPGLPDWIPTVPVPGHTGPKMHVAVDDLATLVAVTNAYCVELHVPQWRHPRPELHDRLVIDLDPGPGRTVLDCALVARGVQVILEADGISSWPKTSGSKGIHVLAALAPSPAAAVSGYAKTIARRLEEIWPKLVTHTMRKDARPGKVFVDWSQNATAKTTAAPYTLRLGPSPRVSAPVTWQELEDAAEPPDLDFTPAQVLERTGRDGDLLAGLLDPGLAGNLPPVDPTEWADPT
jgi:bifunctional non-homologous end joining protein LigD